MNMAIGESGKQQAAVCINNLRFSPTIVLDIFLRSDSHNLVTSYGESLCPRLPRVDGINFRVQSEIHPAAPAETLRLHECRIHHCPLAERCETNVAPSPCYPRPATPFALPRQLLIPSDFPPGRVGYWIPRDRKNREYWSCKIAPVCARLQPRRSCANAPVSSESLPKCQPPWLRERAPHRA